MKKLLMSAGIACIVGAGMASCSGNAAPKEGEKGQTSDATAAVIENIMTRKSIRQFTSQPISKDTLDLLVRAGMAAPSAVDKRPWQFVVINEKAVLDSLNANHPYANLKTATAAIVVCGELSKDDPQGINDYWVQDCSAATENILLAAHAYGLGAVWCGVYPREERVAPVKRILGLPENVIPLNVITLGYPAQNPDVKNKWNPDKIHYNRY